MFMPEGLPARTLALLQLPLRLAMSRLQPVTAAAAETAVTAVMAVMARPAAGLAEPAKMAE